MRDTAPSLDVRSPLPFECSSLLQRLAAALRTVRIQGYLQDRNDDRGGWGFKEDEHQVMVSNPLISFHFLGLVKLSIFISDLAYHKWILISMKSNSKYVSTSMVDLCKGISNEITNAN